MKPERFEQELRYQTVLSVFRNMYGSGLISDEDFRQVERMLNEKYHPVFRAA